MVVIAKRQNQRHPESIEGSHFTLTDSELPVDIPIPRWEWRRCALGVDELLQLVDFESMIQQNVETGNVRTFRVMFCL